MKPTYEQVKEFWEWCGWNYTPTYKRKSLLEWGWQSPSVTDGEYQDYLPSIDLNNLFKYAVPKLKSKAFLVLWMMRLIEDWAEGKEPNPALALFWAIYEVMK